MAFVFSEIMISECPSRAMKYKNVSQWNKFGMMKCGILNLNNFSLKYQCLELN
jgi:hypothetical protein